MADTESYPSIRTSRSLGVSNPDPLERPAEVQHGSGLYALMGVGVV